MHLEIITPGVTLFQGTVTAVTVPGIEGEFQVLNNHAAIVSTLGKGTIKVAVDEGGAPELFAIAGGTVEVKDNTIVVLVD